jgi:arylsulfatase A-like enzyme
MPTVPARRSILTAQRAYPFRGWEPWLGLAKRPGWSPIMPGTQTMMTALSRAGYFTSYVTDNPFLGHGKFFEPFRRTVDDFVALRGHRKYQPTTPGISRQDALHYLPPPLRTKESIEKVRHYLFNNGNVRNESEQAAARVFTRAGDALSDAKGNKKPFCLVVDSFDPHEPWTPPRKYLSLYTDDVRGQQIADVKYRPADYLSKKMIERLRAAYKAEVTMTDRWLGVFLDRLHDLKLDDKTAIVLVSDHGLYLGERNWTGKSDSKLHPELIQVPMMVRDQEGRGAGTTSDYFATTVDVAPTLFSMAGLRRPRYFDGNDLSPITRGEDARRRDFAYGGYSSWTFIRDERWKLIVRNDKRELSLFDLDADPGEHRNVASAHPKQVDRLWREVVRKAGGKRPPYFDRPALDAQPRRSF